MDVVGFGRCFVDLLIRVEKIAEDNRISELLDYSLQGGGPVATALVTLARLGAKAGMIGVVGSGAYGAFCLEDFKWNGVDTSRVKVKRGFENPFCVILSSQNNNSRNIYIKRSHPIEFMLDSKDKDYIASAKYLHLVNANAATVEAAKHARENGVKVVFDAQKADRETSEMLQFVDVLIASEEYYNYLFTDRLYEKNCSSIREKGPETVIFTFGEKGCVGADSEGFFQQGIFHVNVIDTTGSGDVFHGAYIFGMLQGWDSRRTAAFASAAAGIKCTRLGGRAAIPDLETILKFMETGQIDFSDIDIRTEKYRRAWQFEGSVIA